MKKLLGIVLLLAIALPVGAQTSIDTARTWINPSSGTQTGTLSTPNAAAGVPGTVSGYTPLEPLKAGFKSYASFADYLSTVYRLTITIGALIAVVMLVTGGVRYMLSEGFTDVDKAKLRIRSALYGLLILVGSFLILYTINPNLLNFNLLLPKLQNTQSDFGVAAGGGSSTNQANACRITCPTNYYCDTASGTCFNNAYREVQARSDACAASGGRWQVEMFSTQYCWLNNATDQSSCAQAGGTWYDPSYFSSIRPPYCYKP